MLKKRIRRDTLWRNRLVVSRDVWGKHPDELLGTPFAPYMMVDMMALAIIEQEEMESKKR